TEIETLKSEHQVSGKTNFSNSEFIYSLIINDSEEDISAEFENGHLKVKLSKTIAADWIESEQVDIKNTDNSFIKILIEKDFQCLHERTGEDESDSFPNPLAENSKK
ncbi:MAG: tryptophanyl-tRNA synthetase, partial [Cyclobacteriaceae bacterium]